MTITRSNPDIGYIGSAVFEGVGFTQTIRAGNTIYLSGVAPLKGDSLESIEIVGAGDMRAQITYVLDVIGKCLEKEGATWHNWVMHTIYVTDVAKFNECLDVMPGVFGKDSPTATLVEVKGLFHPEQMVEITGIAVID